MTILRVDFSGPFFTRDPKKTVRSNIRDMLDKLAAEMEADVQVQMAAHAGSMPAWTGWSRQRVRGRTESISGRHWALSAVVSSYTGDLDARLAIRTLAAGSTIERRWHPFRRTATAVRRSRVLLGADLTKGLE